MRVAMPLAKTQPLWDAAPILNIQIKYPLLDKLRFFENAQNHSQSPPPGSCPQAGSRSLRRRVGGQLAQACSKRRGESANTNGLLEKYPNAGD